MKIFLSISAILAWLFGAVQLLMPEQFFAQAGITVTPMVATIAQAHGATLFGMGIVLWLARNAERKGLIAVLGGNLVVQILSLLVALHMMTLSTAANAMPAIVIHVVLGSFYTFFLLKIRKTPAA